MAPSATLVETVTHTPKTFHVFPKTNSNETEAVSLSTNTYVPLELFGALNQYEQVDLTPLLGTRFENINLTEILRSPECDEKIRDIAITGEYCLSKILLCIICSSGRITLRLSVPFLY